MGLSFDSLNFTSGPDRGFGITTSAEVSQVSGRGVGMHAVKRFLECEQGSIVIVIGEVKDPQGDYYNFKFLITLPKHSLGSKSKVHLNASNAA